MMKLLVGAIAIALAMIIMVAAPSFFLFDDDHVLAFDDAALRIAVEGTWRVVPARGVPFTVVIHEGTASTHFSSRGFIRSAAACSGEHTFVRSAAACEDTTRMPLDVRVEGELHSGELFVVSRHFERGHLVIELGASAMGAMISPSGVATEAEYRGMRATMVRISAH